MKLFFCISSSILLSFSLLLTPISVSNTDIFKDFKPLIVDESDNPKRINDKRDRPDPAGLYFDGKYYAYTTSTRGSKLSVSVSDDNIKYTTMFDAFKNNLSQFTGALYAPDLFYNGHEYILYYAGISKNSDLRSIYFAKSQRPEGPFVAYDTPLVSNDDLGGVIDPEIFKDSDGKNYLLYKNEGVKGKSETSIWVQEVDDSATKIVGSPKEILNNGSVPNPPNNGSNKMTYLIESPSIVKAPDGTYVLFISGNGYINEYYFTGYATSNSIDGPFTYRGPIMTTDSMDRQILGPGGAKALRIREDDYYLIFHGWSKKIGYDNGGIRELYTKKLLWQDGNIPKIENIQYPLKKSIEYVDSRTNKLLDIDEVSGEIGQKVFMSSKKITGYQTVSPFVYTFKEGKTIIPVDSNASTIPGESIFDRIKKLITSNELLALTLVLQLVLTSYVLIKSISKKDINGEND